MEPPSSASFPPKERLSGRPPSETQWAGFAASELRGITRSRNAIVLLFVVDVVVLLRLKAQSITFHSHFLEIISHLLLKINVRSVTQFLRRIGLQVSVSVYWRSPFHHLNNQCGRLELTSHSLPESWLIRWWPGNQKRSNLTESTLLHQPLSHQPQLS